MKRSILVTRRGLIRAVASAVGIGVLPASVRRGLADEKPPSDRGIGGTGITSAPEGGAIGFIGSIQRFGSIYVNGSRITYPLDARVVVDGRVGGPDDLIIGQVVKTVARRIGDRLATDHVEVLSEVVGPVEAREGSVMIVLGQRVDCGTTGTNAFAIGERLAVSGIRRLDGTIVARLIQPAAWRADQVVGPAHFEGWTLRVGGLQLLGPDARYAGQRVVARGSAIATGLKVSSIALDRPPEAAGVSALSIEAFAARHGDELHLGSGLVFDDHQQDLPPHQTGMPNYLDIKIASDAAPRMQGEAGHDWQQQPTGGFDGRQGMHGMQAEQPAATGPGQPGTTFANPAAGNGAFPGQTLSPGGGPHGWTGGQGGTGG